VHDVEPKKKNKKEFVFNSYGNIISNKKPICAAMSNRTNRTQGNIKKIQLSIQKNTVIVTKYLFASLKKRSKSVRRKGP
jgi:hypothetical protein